MPETIHTYALKEFVRRMGEIAPSFKKIQTGKQNEVVLEEQGAGHLRLKFVARAVKDGHGDRMTVECIWTTRESGFLPTREFCLPYRDEVPDGMRFRLSWFWREPGPVDESWWQLSQETTLMDNIRSLKNFGRSKKSRSIKDDRDLADKSIENIARQIKMHALPYFEEIRRVVGGGLDINTLKR